MALRVEGMDAFAGELTVETSGADGPSRETFTSAFAEAEGLRFPAFTLQPQSMLLGLVSGMLGVEAVHIEREPRFSSAYHLAGVHAQKTRALFSDSVVAWFADHPGLRLESAGRGLLLYRVAGAACQDFAGDVPTRGAIFHPWCRRIRNPRLQRCPVSSRLPTSMHSLRNGAAFAYGFRQQGRLEGLGNGRIVRRPGVPLAFFFARSRYRIKRLLKRGALASATIDGLEDSGVWTTSTGPIWKLKLRYRAQGQAHQAECRISGHGIERARDAAEARRPVRILYDTARPKRVLYADDLITASPEYDS